MAISTVTEIPGYIKDFSHRRELYSVLRTRDSYPTPHRHPQEVWEICYVVNAEGRYFIDKTFYPMRKGDVFLVNNREIHRVVAQKADRINVMFKPRLLKKIPDSEGLHFEKLFVRRPRGKSNLVLLDDKEKDDVAFLMFRLLHEFEDECEECHTITFGYLVSLLGIIRKAYLRDSRHEHIFTATEELVHRMAHVIEDKIKERLTLTELAAKAGVTPNYFSTVFKKVTGIPLITYVNLKRLQIAKRLLRETDLKVSSVGLEAGFNDVSHFNRVFKNELKMSPLHYRKFSKE